MNKPVNVRHIAKHAMKNKGELDNSPLFGCYSCMHTGETKEITEWTDKGETAICPNCKTDTILSGSITEINKDNLKSINEFWFQK